jgi:hypothetical protein
MQNQADMDETKKGHRPDNLTVQLHMNRRVYVGIWLLLIAPWVLLAAVFVAGQLFREVEKSGLLERAEQEGRRTHGKPGPWGQLEYVRIAIEPPEELVYITPADEAPTRWAFKGFDQGRLAEFLRTAGMPAEQIALLQTWAKPDAAAGGVVVTPPPEFVLGLESKARSRIYAELARFPENESQRFPFSMRPQFIEERFEASGLAPHIIADIRKMLYSFEDFLLLADVNVILPRLAGRREKVRVLKTLARKNTMVARLMLDEKTDVEKIVNYWAFGGRAKDVRPLLESLRRVPGGAKIDIAHLLPQFARRRLYTYPYPSDSAMDARRDCHWTSLNFFNSTPDDRYGDPAVAQQVIHASYYPISLGATLGDLVLVTTPKGEVVHSAVYIADDIVFTKNGAAFSQPWLLMRLDDLLTFFSSFYQNEGKLKAIFYRKREG